MFIGFCRKLFKWKGWVINNSIPFDLKKFIVVVAPHTSNYDFFIGVAVRDILKVKTYYLAKKELFVFPVANFFKKLGGFPVDRKNKTNIVDVMCNYFNQEQEFSICVTPEGTRKYAPTWKTGFYRIAEKAQVPIILLGLDYPSKSVTLSDPFFVTGNMEADFENMKVFFRKMIGKNPENGVK
jgi:1-acyl-sn-glycerol-3-phosphate acyltransferase